MEGIRHGRRRRTRPAGDRELRRVRPDERRPQEATEEERLIGFALAAAIPLYLALNDGGLDLTVVEPLAIALWWVVALGLLFGILPRSRGTRDMLPGLVALGALVALTAAGLIWTESAERTYAELARVVGYAGVVVLILGGVTSGSWRAVAAGLAAVALLIPALALASRLFPAFFPDNGGEYRLSYPLGYWNAVGCWSAAAIALGLAFSLGGSKTGIRAAALAGVPIAAVAVYLTYSRGAVLAAAIGVATVVVLARDRRRAGTHAAVALLGALAAIAVIRGQPEIANGSGDAGSEAVLAVLLLAMGACVALVLRWRRRATLAAPPRARVTLAVALGLVLVTALAASSRVAVVDEGRLDPVRPPASVADPAGRLVSTEDVRRPLWSQAFEAWVSRPVTGIGAGTFELWWTRHRDDRPVVRDAHSLYIESLAELGPVGVLAVLVLLAGLARAGLRARAASAGRRSADLLAGLVAVVFVFAAQASVDWIWEVPAVTVLALAAGACAAASAAPPRTRRLRGSGWLAAGALVAIVLGAVAIPDLAATGFQRDSQRLLVRGDLELAAERAEDAVAAESWSATAHAQRALVAERMGDLALAREAAARAVELEPTEWRHRVLLARVALRAGDVDAARRNIERAGALLDVRRSPTELTPELLRERLLGE